MIQGIISRMVIPLCFLVRSYVLFAVPVLCREVNGEMAVGTACGFPHASNYLGGNNRR